MRRGDIPKLFNEKFWRAYEIWDTWRILKILPNGGGWLNENPWTIKIIKEFQREFESAQNDINLQEMKKRKK